MQDPYLYLPCCSPQCFSLSCCLSACVCASAGNKVPVYHLVPSPDISQRVCMRVCVRACVRECTLVEQSCGERLGSSIKCAQSFDYTYYVTISTTPSGWGLSDEGTGPGRLSGPPKGLRAGHGART